MTHEFSLRKVGELDHHWLIELHNDPVTLKNVTHPESITLATHMKWWAGLDEKKNRRFVFMVDDRRVGFAKIDNIDEHNRSCVLGADIHIRYRGNGYAKHMWALIINYCVNELSMHRMSLTFADFNVIGERVYRKLGFKEEGRLVQSLLRDGRYYDQICMYLMTDDWIKRPGQQLSLPSF